MIDDDTKKLNAIVGAAIRGLVDSGADDGAIGEFAHEHHQRVAEILGLSTTVPITESLHAMVVGAVTEALTEAGISIRKPRERSRRMNVSVHGKRSTVTVGRQLFDHLVEAKGGQAQARQFIEDLANRTPDTEENRSRWVRDRVAAFLSSLSGGGANEARH